MFPKGNTVCLMQPERKDLVSPWMKEQLLRMVQKMVLNEEAFYRFRCEHSDEAAGTAFTFTGTITADYRRVAFRSMPVAWRFQARVSSPLGDGLVSIYVDPDRIETVDIGKLRSVTASTGGSSSTNV